jgi:hypothetical protein
MTENAKTLGIQFFSGIVMSKVLNVTVSNVDNTKWAFDLWLYGFPILCFLSFIGGLVVALFYRDGSNLIVLGFAHMMMLVVLIAAWLIWQPNWYYGKPTFVVSVFMFSIVALEIVIGYVLKDLEQDNEISSNRKDETNER